MNAPAMPPPSNIVPIRALPHGPGGTVAVPIVTTFRAGDIADDVVDALTAYQNFARTCYLLQRKLDEAQEAKRRITKELGRQVKRAWEEFGKHFAPEQWRGVDEAIAAAIRGEASKEQLDTLTEWCRDTRAKFLGHDSAKLSKEGALKAASGRIEDLEIALRRVILEQPGAKAEAPQMDLPNVKATQAPGASGVWDAKVRKTVVEVFAEEVSSTRAKAAAPEVDADTRAAAEAQAAADEAMVAALKAMGLADEALPDDDLEGLDDEAGETNTGTPADDKPEQAELPIVDATATEVSEDDELEAAGRHEALQSKPKAGRGGKGKAK